MENEKTCRECEYFDWVSDQEPCKSCNRVWYGASEDNWTAVKDEPKTDLIKDMIESFGLKGVKNYLVCNAFVALWQSKGKDIKRIEAAKWFIDKLLELEG